MHSNDIENNIWKGTVTVTGFKHVKIDFFLFFFFNKDFCKALFLVFLPV